MKENTTYYSCLEQHTNGSWWYHGKTFLHDVEARGYIRTAIDWRDSMQRIIRHTTELPKETLWSWGCREFCRPGDSRPVVTIDAEVVYELAKTVDAEQDKNAKFAKTIFRDSQAFLLNCPAGKASWKKGQHIIFHECEDRNHRIFSRVDIGDFVEYLRGISAKLPKVSQVEVKGPDWEWFDKYGHSPAIVFGQDAYVTFIPITGIYEK